MNRVYHTYDLESYPNIFTYCGKFSNSDQIYMFEISDRMNQINELLNFLNYLRNSGVEMVGFNSIGYDYFLIHELLTNPYTFTYQKAHQLTSTIIVGPGLKNISFWHRYIPQIDLFKLNHFDNAGRHVSLKALQFAMRSESVEDLPFDIRPLTDPEKDQLKTYNIHDVLETEKFLTICEGAIEQRREYITDGTLRGDVLNYSDVKIGMEYLMKRIGREKCYTGNKPNQTWRNCVHYKDVILPKIKFRTKQFKNVLEWFKAQTIYTRGGKFPKTEIKLADVDFIFGAGGVHASVERKIYQTTKTHEIIDIDVSGMYVAVGIANRFAPEHLGESFVNAYSQVKSDRSKYAKGTAKNKALKLAGNGAYGKSNSPFSWMYDPKYTFSVTVNGQLQLIQLVELLSLIPSLEIIQANTDGITIYMHKDYEHFFKFWCSIWEQMTGLELEEVKYKRMWIRDVNNYIAEKLDGSLKRKGAYWYPTCIEDYEGTGSGSTWHKDFSNHASIIAAERAMTHSWPIESTIRLITDKFDFMHRYKTPKGATVYIGDQPQSKTVRYYVSTAGEPMKKIAKPKGEIGQFKRKNKISDKLFHDVMKEIGKDVWDERIHTKNKSKYQMNTTSIQSGYLIKNCNHIKDFNWLDVDWNYYIEEAKKLVIGN